MSKCTLLKYNDKQEIELINEVEKHHNIKHMAIMRDDNALDMPDILMFGPDHQTFMTSGLGMFNFSRFRSNRVELLMLRAKEDASMIEDSLYIMKQFYTLLKKLTDGTTKIKEEPGFKLSFDFKERFGYDYALLIEAVDEFKIHKVGKVKPLLVLPIYDAEYNYLKDYKDDEGRVAMFICDIQKIYKDKRLPVGAINVTREQLSYV